jgi:hypothetical protein
MPLVTYQAGQPPLYVVGQGREVKMGDIHVLAGEALRLSGVIRLVRFGQIPTPPPTVPPCNNACQTIISNTVQHSSEIAEELKKAAAVIAAGIVTAITAVVAIAKRKKSPGAHSDS